MRTNPMRALQVATTVAALLAAQSPAFAQPAPAAPVAAPAPAPAPAPAAAPAPADRSPAPDLPVEPEPLPPWTPTSDVPTPPDSPPPGTPPPATPGEPATPLAGTPTEPAVGPEPPPAPAEPPPSPVDIAAAKSMRKAGAGTMIAGGVAALGGFVVTLAFTLKGTKLENELITAESNYQLDNCSSTSSSKCDGLKADRNAIRDGILSADNTARIGGGIILGGLLVTAIGGIIYRVGMKRLSNADNLSRVRVSPTLGGLSLSGRF